MTWLDAGRLIAPVVVAPLLAACAFERDYLWIRSDWGSTFGASGRYRTGFVHNGIDIGADGDTAIAAADGVVYVAKKDSSGSNTVILDHGPDDAGRRVLTLYAHLAAIAVEPCPAKAGDRDRCPLVKRGSPVGPVGNTGIYAGDVYHLHFGVYVGVRPEGESKTVWKDVDPKPYFLKSDGTLACFNPSNDYAGIARTRFTWPIRCGP